MEHQRHDADHIPARTAAGERRVCLRQSTCGPVCDSAGCAGIGGQAVPSCEPGRVYAQGARLDRRPAAARRQLCRLQPRLDVDAVLAIVAAGANPNSFVSSTGKTPLDYLTTVASSYASQGVRAAGKLATGVARAGADPRNFGGVNLIVQIQNSIRRPPASTAQAPRGIKPGRFWAWHRHARPIRPRP